ncbi:anti-sigma factor [Pedobacter ginsengisoli]|uniref:Anti-sigma factor n=1 Tax=Pedobacter ginsengisoli TaxID=363852 RepID=A0A2D1U0D5_9SPHI|nr:FecR domain-containing protein [Pedobacter ginsengisoli]ATP55067.1 anti-sigma factor [Pedobacter ginsengisoli]
MDSERLQYLFERFHTSNCTKQELEELNNWYEELGAGSNQIDHWINLAGGEEELSEELYRNFSKRKNIQKKHQLFSWSWKISAASILILLGTGLLFYKLFPDHSEVPTELVQVPILPGKNKAMLTLADGTKIVLDDSKNGEISRKNGVLITKTDSGSLAYYTEKNQTVTPDKMAFNTLYVPRGGQYQITLQDGTKVWMNSESKLYFPVTSNGKDRRVRLTGEAYFEVAHNKRLPFKVQTGDQIVSVLGTHFNIKGYPEDSAIATTLLQGSVRISKLSTGQAKMLVPGQQSNLSETGKDIEISYVKTDQAIAWKNGYFLFDNQDIKSVMKTISRWYNVDVTYGNSLGNDRFGGTFSRNANLSELLANLEELGGVRFQISNRNIIVSGISSNQ